MLKSMTAFANATGSHENYTWSWELRSVNGKGLDLRLRVPDWISGLEAALREKLGRALSRGNVTLTLKLSREEGAGRLAVNDQAVADVLAAMDQIESAAMEKGITLAPVTAADVVGIRGVLELGAVDDDSSVLAKRLIADMDPLIDAFVAMRASEGDKLGKVMAAQIDEIETLTQAATDLIEARRDDLETGFREALARVLDGIVTVDEDRVAQEVAVLAVKADVTEELDRLRAHIAAARELLAEGSPIGRKLDFLAQEFNREANTLCSKSQHTELTQVGLTLKTVIDQLREQVQNVE